MLGSAEGSLVYPSVAFVAAVTAVMILRPVAQRVDLVDRPHGHKAHHGEIPVVGGLAIFLSLAMSLALAGGAGVALSVFLGVGLFLLAVGVADDLYELPARIRLVAHVAAGLAMAGWGGVVVTDLGALLVDGQPLSLGPLAVPFTVVCLVGVVNAFNMADGLDGLAGTLALVALGALALVADAAGRTLSFSVLLVLIAAVLGFLVFNMRTPWRARASVFLGDAGSTLLGFVVTWFAVWLAQEGGPGEPAAVTPVTALWFIAVPLFDMTSMMLRRILRGHSPFRADREHFHHVLLAAGYRPAEVVVVMAVLAVALAGVGLTGYLLGVPEHYLFWGFLGLFALHFGLVQRAWRVMRFLHRPMCRRRTGSSTRRSGRDRRGTVALAAPYQGPERRSGRDRRQIPDRRLGACTAPATPAVSLGGGTVCQRSVESSSRSPGH